MRHFLYAAALALTLACTAPAESVIFTLSPSTQFTPPGGIGNPACDNGSLRCLIFSGTITPNPSMDTLLNAIQITFSPVAPLLTNIDNFFFDNVPGLLFSTDPAYTGPIFALEVANNIPYGTYNGTATLLGGADPSAQDALASSTFTVVVTPEPGTWLLVGTALAAMAMWRRRSH